MGSTVHHVLGANVDNVAANGAGGVEGQSLVLTDGEGVQLSFVDGSLVDGVGNRGVDQFAGGERK